MKTVHQMIADLTPKLAPLEEIKNSDLKKIKLIHLFFIFATFIFLLSICIFHFPSFLKWSEFVIIGSLSYGFFNLFSMGAVKKREYKSSFKNIIMPAVFDAFNMNLEYRQEHCIPQQEFIKCEVFPVLQFFYHGEDYIESVYNISV